MPVSVRQFFGLGDSFTWEELQNALNSKRDQISNSNLSQLDKEVYLDQVDRYYRDAKRDLTMREREEYDYGLIPWGGRQLGLRNWLWDGMDYLDRMERRLNNRFFRDISSSVQTANANSSFSQSSFREIRQHDGTSIVVEENEIRNGDQVQKNNVSYRRLADGTTQPLDYNEACNLLKNPESNSKKLT